MNHLEPIKESKYVPEVMTSTEASKLLKDKRNVIILTGAGLSAASGIPTFRGAGGFWTKKYEHCESPEDLATRRFFVQHPEIKWDWCYDFSELVRSCEPNAGHKAICAFQEHCIKSDNKCTLITQNIDGLHTQLIEASEVLKPGIEKRDKEDFSFNEHVYEVHGNLFYMRCFEECSPKIYSIPPRDKR